MNNLLPANDLWPTIRHRIGRAILAVGVVVTGGSMTTSAMAQEDRGREERREERGDRDREERREERGRDEECGERRSFDPKDFLTRMDENKNGVLDPNEISGRSRGFLSRAAEQAKINLDQPVPLDK